MPDPLFTELYDDTRDLTWPATEQVRQRAAQRSRRRRLAAVAAAAAAVIAVSGGVVAIGGWPAATPVLPAPADSPYRPVPPSVAPPSPAATPSPAAPTRGTGVPAAKRTAGPPVQRGPVPTAALLQPSDVPRHDRVSDTALRPGQVVGSGDWQMPIRGIDCDPDEQLPGRIVAGHQRGLTRPDRPDSLVIEQVTRFGTAEQARRYLQDVRTMVLACKQAGDGVFLSIVVQDFAGPGSLVVRSMADPETKTLHVLVRRGNLLAVVWVKQMPTDQEAVRLGVRAAARLCAGTDC